MKEIEFNRNIIFTDSSGNIIQVLQRRLDGVASSKEEELVPFFHEPSFFQLSCNESSSVERLVGRLSSISVGDNLLSFVVVDLEEKEFIFSLKNDEKIFMTVWRINNVLDTLQINIFSRNTSLYMQTGGAYLKQIFDENRNSSSFSNEIEKAEFLFASCALPSVTERDFLD